MCVEGGRVPLKLLVSAGRLPRSTGSLRTRDHSSGPLNFLKVVVFLRLYDGEKVTVSIQLNVINTPLLFRKRWP